MIEKKNIYPYNNRELSWMDFNLRVLEEAIEESNPIMERLRFLSITASNLDEFFMVRVAGVMDQIDSGITRADMSGLTPSSTLEKLTDKIHHFSNLQYKCFHENIVPKLKENHFNFLKVSELDNKQKKFVNNYFYKVLFPVLTPLAVDVSRPFPFLANKTLNIAVRLKKDEKSYFAVVQVPSILPRFLKIPGTKSEKNFVLLEDIIIEKLSDLFELHEIKASCAFRITRDADLEIDEETDDLLTEIEKSIKKRKRGRPVRLEITEKCDKETRKFLVGVLEIEKKEIYEINGPIDLTFLSKFADENKKNDLIFPAFKPINPPADFWGCNDIFKAIREKDRMLCHPYESFDYVINFIKQAAEDENVLAIKQTLYRVSGHSPIISALIRAAENGKQVTVLLELKARFDEENNILWAKKLEKAGCHVIYGLAGLKTHCKICLVVRREKDGIRRYLHMGTGNYNDSTAKLYTDIGVFTAKESFGVDASSLFNVLTGYSRPPEYNEMIVAPLGMRKFFINMINNEINNANNGLKSGITIKVNSLVDYEIISLLYKASAAGVEIKLIVRGICCLIPNVEGISENISVTSIVGRFLEHSRIFKFENAGDPKVYMGSADLMPRNLNKRVELIFPIEDQDLKNRTFKILDIILKDNKNARVCLNDGSYVKIKSEDDRLYDSQVDLFKLLKKIQKTQSNKEDNIVSQQTQNK